MKKQFLLMTILCLAASLMRAERTYAAGQDPEVSILENYFDCNYIRTDENSFGSFIRYSIKNASENLVFRYTLKDYASWKDNLYIESKGVKATIGGDGSFKTTVRLEEIQGDEYYFLLNAGADKVGEVTYDIQVFTASDTENPVFTKTDNKMVFANRPRVVFDKQEISGAVGQEIPFTFRFENVSDVLKGKPLKLIFETDDETVGQVQLFDAQGSEFPLYGEDVMEDFSAFTDAVEASIPVGKCEENKSYTFKIKSNTVFPVSQYGLPLELSISVVVDDHRVIGSGVWITVNDGPTANEEIEPEIEADETRVWASAGRLFIHTPKAETARIVTFDGRLYRTLSLPAGESSVSMPRGLYIVRIGDRSYKLGF